MNRSLYWKLFKIHSWDLSGKFSQCWGKAGTRNSFFGIILGGSCFTTPVKWVFIGKDKVLSFVPQFWENAVNFSHAIPKIVKNI